jgi:hypothetical protein
LLDEGTGLLFEPSLSEVAEVAEDRVYVVVEELLRLSDPGELGNEDEEEEDDDDSDSEWLSFAAVGMR